MRNDYRAIAWERNGRVLRLTLDRPEKLNAIDDELHHELSVVFDDAAEDDASDIVVLTGAGRAFCAGGDPRWMQSMIDDPAKFRRLGPPAKRLVYSLLELEKPILCELNGPAAGLGATIALMCDVIIASDRASIGDPHVKMGFVAGDGGAVIWPQLIGYALAKELLMTGRMVKADEALAMRLINRVVPHDELRAAVDAMAGELAHGATWAIRWTKTVTNIPLRKLAHELMDASCAYEMLSNLTRDHQEAVTAFVEKRPAVFTGL